MNEKTVIKFVPFKDVSNPHFCVWLQEMATKGFEFQSLEFVMGKFKETEPQNRRYRPIYRSIGDMTEEEKAIYEESRWSLIKVSGKYEFCVATTADSEAPEIYTDNQSYSKSTQLNWMWYAPGIAYLVYMMKNPLQYFKSDVIEGVSLPNPVFLILGLMILIAGTLCIVDDICTMLFLKKREIPDFNISFGNRSYRYTIARGWTILLTLAGELLLLFVIMGTMPLWLT